MILPDFVLPSQINQVWLTTGIDSEESCKDPAYFKSYPYPIEYRYNDRGYRDDAWPDNLQHCVWCLGDSFTVGIGSPRSHTWPYLLQQGLGQRTINVSMDGASNMWIARKARRVLEQIRPHIMIIHWSYLTRTELPDSYLTDEQRRQHYHPDLLDTTRAMQNFRDLVLELEAGKRSTRIIHSFIPDFAVSGTLHQHWQTFAGPSWPDLPRTLARFDTLPDLVIRELRNEFASYDVFRIWSELNEQLELVPEFDRLDLARDGHHYDLLTAQHFVSGVRNLLQR